MHIKELFNVQGKVAVVTGGAVGLGEQMATALAEAGANVALSARKVERCKATAEKIRKAMRGENHGHEMQRCQRG